MNKALFEELDLTIAELRKENQELKKQLEDANEKIILLQASEPMLNFKKALEETQQQEFIKYLENGIYICDGFIDTIKSDLQEMPYGIISANEIVTTRIIELETAHKIYEEILQKYKEITGISDENKRN